MEIGIFLYVCVLFLIGHILPDLIGFFKEVYNYISGYLYDIGADLEGIKSIEELDDENEK